MATTTRTDPLTLAYSMLYDWRATVRGAGFHADGAPAKAYRLAHAALIRGGDRGAALVACEDALAEWCAGGVPNVIATCQPVLDGIRAELAGAPAAA